MEAVTAQEIQGHSWKQVYELSRSSILTPLEAPSHNVCHAFMTKKDSENASFPNITHTESETGFSPFWSTVERWKHAAPLCLEGSLSEAPANGSANFSDSIIARYLLQLHFDDLGDNTKSKETVIFILTFPQNASFPDKAIALWIWKAYLKALLKCSALVFNQKRWNGSNPYTTMAQHTLGCARRFPF